MPCPQRTPDSLPSTRLDTRWRRNTVTSADREAARCLLQQPQLVWLERLPPACEAQETVNSGLGPLNCLCTVQHA